MKSFHRGLGVVSLVLVLMFCTNVWGAAQNRGLIGQWHMMLEFDTGQMPSVLTFTKDAEGAFKAEWVHIMGISQVSNIKRDGKDLTFTVVTRLGDQDSSGSFVGTLEKGTLSGLITTDESDIHTKGKKLKRMPLIVGPWDMTIKMGEREFNTVLKVTMDDEGTLQAEWQSQWGEHEITDVQFKNGELTFNRVSTFDDREWKTTYKGTMKNHVLTGTFSSDQGELPVNGKRANGLFVGKWDLTIESYQGTSTQRLRILPDLTARFGAMPIKDIKFEDQQVSFDLVLPFGDNDYKMSFKGQLEARKLTGTLTTDQGTSDVTGTKVRPVKRKK